MPATRFVYAYDNALDKFNATTIPYGITAGQSVYSYDKAGQLTGVQAPGGVVTHYSYSPRGHLESFTNGRGQTVTYGYDKAGRTVSQQLPDNRNIVQVLDGFGNRTSTTLNGATVVTRSFDAMNRMISRGGAAPDTTVEYGYTPMGQVKTLTYPGQAKPVTYVYDGLQRLWTVTDWAGRVTTYDYNPTGTLLSASMPNGVVETNSFDRTSRFTGFETQFGADILASAATPLNAFGEPSSVDEVLPLAPVPPAARVTYKLCRRPALDD